ncbi:MAG: glycosyltransferase family 4 protein [Steroidobacterales bacterium]
MQQSDKSQAPVLLDITRLIGRAHRAGPSGIDRIELAYAQHFLVDGAAGRPAFAVVHLRGWVFGLRPDCARRFVRKVAARWQGGSVDGGGARPAGIVDLYATLLLGAHWMAGWELRLRLKRHRLPPVYLVVSHHELSNSVRLEKIRRRFGARVVGFLHDLIPVEYPEYVEEGLAQRHRRMLKTIAGSVDSVIVNSQTTAASLRRFLGADAISGKNFPQIHVALPGITPFPLADTAADMPAADSVPYFVIIGTIEPKKNHVLLLKLWMELAKSMAMPPRLLVVGARGWQCRQAVELLEQSRRLHGPVDEHNQLNDFAVGSLLRGARAVLLPSLVEGFGLPLAEALASGIPVICSDIPAFREIGREVPDFLDPQDREAWRAAVIDYCAVDSPRRAAQLQRLARWSAPQWATHFGIVDDVLTQASASPRIAS